jgi:hypothetical protein
VRQDGQPSPLRLRPVFVKLKFGCEDSSRRSRRVLVADIASSGACLDAPPQAACRWLWIAWGQWGMPS